MITYAGMKKKTLPQEVVITKKCRVKGHGEETAMPCEPGDVVTVSGHDKEVLVGSGRAIIHCEENSPAIKKLVSSGSKTSKSKNTDKTGEGGEDA